MMLVSLAHSVEVFYLTMKSLVRSTDFSKFEKVYFCCNAIGREHASIINKFCRDIPNAEMPYCKPSGHHPCVPKFINSILENHPDSPIIKTDDDMFFTPGWADRLIEHYDETRDDPDLGLIAPLIPINTQGIQCLFSYLNDAYGERFREAVLQGPQLNSNVKLQSLVWEGVMNDYLIERFVSRLDDPIWEFGGPHAHISINCVMFDRRLSQHFAPLPLYEAWYLDGNKLFDENAMVFAMREQGLKGHVVQDAVVHHYCFNQSKKQIHALHPLRTVIRHILDTKRVDWLAQRRKKVA